MKVGLLNDKNKIKDVVFLIAKVFFKGDLEKLIIQNKILSNNNIIIVENDNNKIVGTSIIIDREIFFNGNLIKASFISFVCVDEKYRGLGLSRDLINCFIYECKKRNSIISVVVARKLVDNFYKKFNFYGISQYSKIKINLDANFGNQKFEFVDLKQKYYKKINSIYNSTYSKTHGAFKRDLEYWFYVEKKASSLGLKSIAIINKKLLKGYIIYDKNNIYEIALDDNINYIDVLCRLSFLKKINKDITVHCSLEHPINLFTNNLDYSLILRQCNYGGHMIRINDLGYLKKIFLNQVNKNNKVLEKLKINIEKLNNKNLNYEKSSLLVSSNILSNSKFFKESLLKSFNIPLMDQI